DDAEITDVTYSDRRVGASDDFMTVRVRCKELGGAESTQLGFPVEAGALTATPSADFAFASAVVELGLLASGSAYRGDVDLDAVRERAAGALGADPYGLRAEFVDLVAAYPR